MRLFSPTFLTPSWFRTQQLGFSLVLKDDVTLVLASLHRLPVPLRIEFKINTFKACWGLAPHH